MTLDGASRQVIILHWIQFPVVECLFLSRAAVIPAHIRYYWVNKPMLGEFCFTMTARADIEGSKSNVTMSACPPQACYPCRNSSETSCLKPKNSEGLWGPAFLVCVHTENQDQVSFCPSPQEMSVLPKLTLGHLCYHLTGILPQSRGPPVAVLRTGRTWPACSLALGARASPVLAFPTPPLLGSVSFETIFHLSVILPWLFRLKLMLPILNAFDATCYLFTPWCSWRCFVSQVQACGNFNYTAVSPVRTALYHMVSRIVQGTKQVAHHGCLLMCGFDAGIWYVPLNEK